MLKCLNTKLRSTHYLKNIYRIWLKFCLWADAPLLSLLIYYMYIAVYLTFPYPKKSNRSYFFIIVYLFNHSLFQNPPTTPAIKGECLLAVNKNGIQFLKLQTHVSYRCLLHCLSFVRKQVCLYLYCMTLSKNMVEECEWGKNPHKNVL